MLNELLKHPPGRNEDPSEDVFVSAVSTQTGEFRIFNGIYPAADFSLQRMLDAVFEKDFSGRAAIFEQSTALLKLSDAIASRCQYDVNKMAPSTQWNDKWAVLTSRLLELGHKAHFSADDLRSLNVNAASLRPFCLPTTDGLLDAPFGRTRLCRFPLVAEGDGFVIPIPSTISPALRLYLAQEVALGTIPASIIEAFHSALIARWLTIDFPLRDEWPVKLDGAPIGDQYDALPRTSEAFIRIDEDKIAHLIVLQADWSRPPRFSVNEVTNAPSEMEGALSSLATTGFDVVKERMGINRGMTLVVYDTPGWNLNFKVPEDPDLHWFCVGASAYSLSVLIGDPDFTLLNLWKSYHGEKHLMEQGILLRIWPDLLTRWSVWQEFHSSFWPEGIDLARFGCLSPGTDLMIDVAARVRTLKNSHASFHPSLVNLRVERWADSLSPEEENREPIYIEPISFSAGQLRASVELAQRVWWISVGRPPFDEEDRNFLYYLWQSGQHWLHRLAQCCDSHVEFGTDSIELELIPVPPVIEGASESIEYKKHDVLRIVKIIFPPSFLNSQVAAGNTGEKILVRALVRGLLMAHDVRLSEEHQDAWVEDSMSDPALKMMHVTFDDDAGMAVDTYAKRPRFRPLQLCDLGSAQRQMRQSLSPNVGLVLPPDEGRLEDVELVQPILHRAVSIHIDRCKSTLRELNRNSTIELTCRLIEGLHRDMTDAERGALARSHFYREENKFKDWMNSRMGMRDAAFIAYRAVAEMALCESNPAGGRRPGLSDIDTVAAEISELLRNAHFSDAVRYELVRPDIGFRPDGGIDLRAEDSVIAMMDYTVAGFEEVVASDIESYPELFEIPNEEPHGEESNQGEVFAAFEAEYGISMRDSAKAVRGLQELAVAERSHVVSLKLSDVKERCKHLESLSLDEDVLFRFLSAFGLKDRPQWEFVAPPYHSSDVMPWFFERRLSLMLRPILIPVEEEDPRLIYGVRQVGMAVHYAASLLENGIWSKSKLRSSIARAYVDSKVQSRGRDFERETAKIVADAGWKSFESRPMRQLGGNKQLGDLDVLAVSPDAKTWIVIECKWFGAARTPREIANWLQDFHGHDGDKLHKHLQRVAWIQANPEKVMSSLALTRPDSILSRIITTLPVPLAFTSKVPSGTEVWTRRELRARLGKI